MGLCTQVSDKVFLILSQLVTDLMSYVFGTMTFAHIECCTVLSVAIYSIKTSYGQSLCCRSNISTLQFQVCLLCVSDGGNGMSKLPGGAWTVLAGCVWLVVVARLRVNSLKFMKSI